MQEDNIYVNSSGDTAVQARILEVGRLVAESLELVVQAVPGRPRGPAELGRVLGVDKVLTSRLLKSIRAGDPMAVLHQAPGPDPMKRVLKSAARKGVSPAIIARAEQAVDEFDLLIRRDIGDRSALQAIISVWLPEARVEFELRRKQAAFRAMSELKGSRSQTSLGTVFLHPSNEGNKLDVVWIFGTYGLQRLRPGAAIKFNSRRLHGRGSQRRPITLDGRKVDDLLGLRLDDHCSDPDVALDVQEVGEVVHYSLADHGFGPASEVDLVFAEVNFAEIDRTVPAGSGRKGYFFADVTIPTKRLVFDVIVHRDVYPRAEPELHIYDTSSDGIASVNDRTRDIDRFDLIESIQHLGTGIQKFRTAGIPRYSEILDSVCEKLGWNGSEFRGYRCKVDYPIYGCQVTMAFEAPEVPADPESGTAE